MTREASPAGSNADYRFEVAISFASDNKQEVVRAVAELLRTKIGDGKVFFYEWFESELAGHDANVVLQEIYGKKTRLVVVCLCERYIAKPWTQDEWRAIQALERNLRDGDTNNVNRMRILPLRFGDGDLVGLFPTAIVPDVRDRSAEKIAELILQRLDHARSGTIGPAQAVGAPINRGIEADIETAVETPERAAARKLISTAIDEIARILNQVSEDEFLQSLARIVAAIQQLPDGDLSNRRTLAEKLVTACRIDELIPRLVPLPDRFPAQSHHLAEITNHLLPCNYLPEHVSELQQKWVQDQLCFFTVPTMTVAESVMAAFDGKPVHMFSSGNELWGAAALPIASQPPVEGPDAHFADAINILKDMIFERDATELESRGTRIRVDVSAQISVQAKALGARLQTRRLRNGERTSYGLVKMPADPDEAHLRRMVLGHIFAEVNKDRSEPVLVFGEIVTPEGKEGLVHRDIESHVRFLLDLPNMRKS
jgi:TIR domain